MNDLLAILMSGGGFGVLVWFMIVISVPIGIAICGARLRRIIELLESVRGIMIARDREIHEPPLLTDVERQAALAMGQKHD